MDRLRIVGTTIHARVRGIYRYYYRVEITLVSGAEANNTVCTRMRILIWNTFFCHVERNVEHVRLMEGDSPFVFHKRT